MNQKNRAGGSLQADCGQTHAEIVRWIGKLKFRKRLIGGVDEADVLRKMEELNRLYEAALLNERARYDALLEKQAGGDAVDRE